MTEPNVGTRTGHFCSMLFSRSVVSASLHPHGLQHSRLPCPSPSLGACSNSCSNAIQPSRPLLSPSSPAFNFSQHQGQLFTSVGQNIRASASWSFCCIDSSHWQSLSQISLLGLLRLSELHHDLGFSLPNPASSLSIFLRCYPQ